MGREHEFRRDKRMRSKGLQSRHPWCSGLSAAGFVGILLTGCIYVDIFCEALSCYLKGATVMKGGRI